MTASGVAKALETEPKAGEYRRSVDLKPALSWLCPWDGRVNFLPSEKVASVQCSCCGRLFPARVAAA
jgi:hypothetical protein